jgi:hypothetical protein
MYRLARIAVVGFTGLLLGTPAFASQCPKLVKQIQDATATRFDATAAAAKQSAVAAQALHSAGKHAESEKTAQDSLGKLGIKP